MSGKYLSVKSLYDDHGDDIDQLSQDVLNFLSFSRASFIYSRLKKLGPWKAENLSIEAIFEIDIMQAALVIEYSRVFVGGSGKVSRGKVPMHLRSVHDEILELRHKRYAHDGGHPTVETLIDLSIEDGRVVATPRAKSSLHLGAPPEWEELIKWLGEFMYDQTQKKLKRLTEKTGLEWAQPMGLAPCWL